MSGETIDKKRSENSLTALRGRNRQGTLSPQAAAVLDRIRPGWNTTQSQRWQDNLDENWQSNLDDTVTWFRTHQRLPRMGNKVPKGRERELGSWLSGQRKYVQPGSDRFTALDTQLPGWNRTWDELWRQNLDGLATWLHDNKRLPQTSGSERDDLERYLGGWLATQRYKLKPGEERHRALEERVPGWNFIRSDHWLVKCEELVSWYVSNGKLPSKTYGVFDEHEWALAGWLWAQRRTLEVDNPRRQVLNEKLPGWDAVGPDRWTRTLDETVLWVTSNQRLPQRSQAALTTREGYLGRWLSGQRRDLAPENERFQTLNERLPGWNATWDDTWVERCDAVVAWYAENQRLPRLSRNDRGTHEWHLGVWLQTQRSKLEPGSARYLTLETRLPEWNASWDELWQDNCDEVLAWVASHQALPRSNGKNLSEEEAFLGRWIGTQRRSIQLNDERFLVLSEKLPGWNFTREELWMRRLSELVLWADSNGRMPRKHGVNVSDDERFLGQWLSNQRSIARGQRSNYLPLSDSRRKALDETLPRWDVGHGGEV